MSIEIKKHYHDALYWATSPQSKGKNYHLTRLQESVLRKLIHYDSSNPKISYSSSTISEHIHLSESQLEKIIPQLTKIGYIKTITFKIHSSDEGYTSRRIINIDWDFIQRVLNERPQPELSKEVSKVDEVEATREPEKIQPKEFNDFDANKYLSKDKLNWLNNYVKQHEGLTIEDFLVASKESLDMFFYPEGIWVINNETEENIYGIRKFKKDGTEGKLINNRDKDTIRLDIPKLNVYLDRLGIEFKDVTEEIFKRIKNEGMQVD